MQRVVLILAVTVLVIGSLGAGILAAHWPFWQRAWQWHVAPTGWPVRIPGAVQVLHGGERALALDVRTDADIMAAASPGTQALLRAHSDGHVDAWFAPGTDVNSLVDGRGLTAVVLAPLFAQLASEQPGLLDTPAGAWLPQWKEDRRGPITPRQLFWQLSGLPARSFTPLDPFSARAQLHRARTSHTPPCAGIRCGRRVRISRSPRSTRSCWPSWPPPRMKHPSRTYCRSGCGRGSRPPMHLRCWITAAEKLPRTAACARASGTGCGSGCCWLLMVVATARDYGRRASSPDSPPLRRYTRVRASVSSCCPVGWPIAGREQCRAAAADRTRPPRQFCCG